MNVLIKVYNFIIVTFLMVSCQKYDDESRPYEFGFTIDGQQHRHEKKDVNGIIQGEFGFITADGIYHVTVYATDENGNFKILSMKNIRISAPLDGSPLPPGAKISALQGTANQVPERQSPNVSNQPKPNIPQPNRPQSNLSSPRLPLRNLVQTTTTRIPFTFTTQPTIKPACGGCGYVTTAKPVPGQRFPFQTPAFQTPNRQINNNQAGGGTAGSYPNQYPRKEMTYPTPGINYSEQGGPLNPKPVLTYPRPETHYSSPGPNYPTSRSNYPTPGPNYSSQGPVNLGANEIVDVGNRATNRPRRPLAQVTVSNGTIHVPGNPDIPIRDKFPGMVDGLPNGITEKDITDLLYKFNYTVGFHGHYEKGLKNGAKIGGYFVTGRDGISRIVTYVADENGFRPKVKFVRLDLNSDEVPKEGTEKRFGLKTFEFIWYPVS